MNSRIQLIVEYQENHLTAVISVSEFGEVKTEMGTTTHAYIPNKYAINGELCKI